jgi:GntR family transcriptional regulator / MocR family aminotransferase
LLSEGYPLPAIAEISGQLDISRSTVKRAFSKLQADGLVTGSANEGYRVCSRAALPFSGSAALEASKRETITPAASVVPAPEPVTPHIVRTQETRSPAAPGIRTYTFNRLSVLDQIDLARLHSSGAPRPFRPGLPATQEFPIEIWESLRARLLRQRMAEMLDFTGTFGYLPLRQAVGARLRNARGVKCSPEQVIICAGAQQALNLVINTLISPDDSVGLEEPGHYGVKAAFLQAGAKVVPLLVDEEGVSVPDARRHNPPLLMYTTPAHQFPLGAALTVARRLALLDFARRTATWIIEDDSDGDFSYIGRPLPSLQGADEQNRVIYLGTTGKTLFPSLEIGYVVVPLSLMESFSKTKEIMGGQPCVIDQAVLAAFVSEGHFEHHLQRMKIIYHQRLQTLGEAVDRELRGFIDLEPANAGLHAVGWLSRGLDENAVADSAARAGIELPLLSNFGRTALVRPGVLFGFASFSEKVIRSTVARFGHSLRAPQKYPALPAGPASLAPDSFSACLRAGFSVRSFRGGR